MATVTAPALGTPLSAPHRRNAAVLTAGCDGYRAGTTGTIVGRRDGCVVFAPDDPQTVARWATARRTLLVPAGFVVTAR